MEHEVAAEQELIDVEDPKQRKAFLTADLSNIESKCQAANATAATPAEAAAAPAEEAAAVVEPEKLSMTAKIAMMLAKRSGKQVEIRNGEVFVKEPVDQAQAEIDFLREVAELAATGNFEKIEDLATDRLIALRKSENSGKKTLKKMKTRLEQVVEIFASGEGVNDDAAIFTADYWKGLSSEGLGVCQVEGASGSPASEPVGFTDSFSNHGYQLCEQAVQGIDLEALAKTAESLANGGWPAVFLFMFDDTWRLVEQLQKRHSSLLGANCQLEPRIAAMLLDPAKKPTLTYAANDISVPRRQHLYNECHQEDGTPSRLLIKVPLRDSVVDNGALYVIPREYDDWYDESDAWEHQHMCQVRADGVLDLCFGVQSVRPLEAKAGDAIALAGSLMHWNAHTSVHEAQPQVQISCCLVRTADESNSALPSMVREAGLASLSAKERVHLIMHSILMDAAFLPTSKTSLVKLFPADLWEGFNLQ